MLRKGPTCPAVFPVSDRDKNSAKLTLTSATHASTHTMKTSAADTQEGSENTLQHIIITRAQGPRNYNFIFVGSPESMFAQRLYSILGRAAESALRRPNHSIHVWSQQTAAIQAVADRYRFVHGAIIMTAQSRGLFLHKIFGAHRKARSVA